VIRSFSVEKCTRYNVICDMKFLRGEVYSIQLYYDVIRNLSVATCTRYNFTMCVIRSFSVEKCTRYNVICDKKFLRGEVYSL
jgi:hypothetical protein